MVACVVGWDPGLRLGSLCLRVFYGDLKRRQWVGGDRKERERTGGKRGEKKIKRKMGIKGDKRRVRERRDWEELGRSKEWNCCSC